MFPNPVRYNVSRALVQRALRCALAQAGEDTDPTTTQARGKALAAFSGLMEAATYSDPSRGTSPMLAVWLLPGEAQALADMLRQRREYRAALRLLGAIRQADEGTTYRATLRAQRASRATT